MPGIEPGAFHMQSERSTAELHPLSILRKPCVPIYHWATSPCGGIQTCGPALYKYFTIWILIPCICIFHEFYLSTRCSYCPLPRETWICRCLLTTESLILKLHLGKEMVIFSDSRLPCVPIFLRKATCIHKSWKLSYSLRPTKKVNSWRCRGLNPGPFTCKANALPLSYIPLRGNTALWPGLPLNHIPW